MGDGEKAPLPLQFKPKVRLELHGATIASAATATARCLGSEEITTTPVKV
jgi:hypothetical protein